MKRTHLLPVIIIIFIVSACGGSPSPEKNTSDSTTADTLKKTVEQNNPVINDHLPDLPQPDVTAITFDTITIAHPRGDTFALCLPKGFKISIAAHGMTRIRFMDRSPDGKLFITDMFNLSDNKKGKVLILDEEDGEHVFQKKSFYLDNLRNPNSLKFHRDKNEKQWLYLAFTDKLVRYPYQDGDVTPSGDEEILDTYPDYGLSYRYGGWHLTRTIEFDDKGNLYVAIGSSCNVCVEKEPVRASVVVMREDGKNKRVYAKGLRNAVGLAWANGALYATNMAVDHLGPDQPDDVMFRVVDGGHYGWPYCYHWNGTVHADPKLDTASNKVLPENVQPAFSPLGAHAAPLGLAWFGKEKASSPELMNYFLVAEHGSYSPAIGRGYSVQRVREGKAPEDFIKGFLDAKGIVHGRPCGIFQNGDDSFFFSDDKFGTLYYVHR